MSWNFHQTYTTLPESLFSHVLPTKVPQPGWAVINATLSSELGLDSDQLSSARGMAELAGCEIPAGSEPIAQAYAGHQFGSFTMLGDGRAVVLGEHVDPTGVRWDVQLKGSGRTPYSRNGDGKAVLGPMLREYIISEAMHALEIPTTRSLAVVTTGEDVFRETAMPGAVLTRIAASHIRVGTFQYAASLQDVGLLQRLADYTIQRHFPELAESDSRYLDLLEWTMRRQVSLITAWMKVGFIHGVMNTDNMAISGETIDYGPCAFIDRYNPATVFSSIDVYGRYAFGNQPPIALWNLSRFAETLLPLLHADRNKAINRAENVLEQYERIYLAQWTDMMRGKLGLGNREEDDHKLIQMLLQRMQQNGEDYINTFRTLMNSLEAPVGIFAADPVLQDWWQCWHNRRDRQPQSDRGALQQMQRATPAVIPRNQRVEEALQAASAEKDYRPLHALLAALQDPYDHQRERSYYQEPPPTGAAPYRTFCGT